MDKLKICIVEDEAIIADSLADILTSLGYFIVGIASDYNEAVEIAQNEKPDFFILDITLKGSKSGLDMARFINHYLKCPFIFLTANSDRRTIEDAKEVKPSAYLVKPFTRNDLYTSIEIAITNFQNRNITYNNEEEKYIFIKHLDNFVKLKISDILYVESEHVYISIHTVSGKRYIHRHALSSFLEKIDSDTFIQVHRSFVVNANYIQSVTSNSLVLSGDHEVSYSRGYRANLMSRLGLKK